MSALPKGGRAVANERLDPKDKIGFFPTPPWATRALFTHVIPHVCGTCWEPAAGEGHMAEVLREVFSVVFASDIHDYGKGYAVGNFVAAENELVDDRARCPVSVDWVISNPPFHLALEFVLRGLEEASHGVAMLMRSNWTEGGERFETLFAPRPPTVIAQFVERVPMHRGEWKPNGDTMTSYSWFVWDLRDGTGRTTFLWIPPGCRFALERPDDRKRFAMGPMPEGAVL